jgi:protein O-mannosyl-transferase
LTGLSITALVWRRRFPYLFVGWFWFVGMLVPVIGLLQVGLQAMADRYTYLPQIGLCLSLTCNADNFFAHNNLGIALAGRGQLDAAIDHYRRALEIKPDYAEAHNNIGIALTERGQGNAAIDHYRRALDIKPDYAVARDNLDLARRLSR